MTTKRGRIIFGDFMITEKEDVLFHQLSHELKNPLAVCKGYLEMIPSSEEKQKEKYYSIIKEEVNRSIGILNSYTKNQFLELELDIINIKELLQEAADLLNPLYKENHSKIILKKIDNHYLVGDYKKLKQVLINLLKNAYEARNQEELIVVMEIESNDQTNKIIITDNGFGMSQDILNNINKEYFTTKKEGTGLGIPYCQKIINLHNGRIDYDSKETLGTKIVITLPKEKSPKTFNSNSYY